MSRRRSREAEEQRKRRGEEDEQRSRRGKEEKNRGERRKITGGDHGERRRGGR